MHGASSPRPCPCIPPQPTRLELARGVVCLLRHHVQRLLRQVSTPAQRRRTMLSAQRVQRVQHGARVALLSTAASAAAGVT